MRELVSLIAAFVTYLCVGTVLTSGLGAGYLWMSGKLDKKKMFQLLAVVHNVNLPDEDESTDPEEAKQAHVKGHSYEEIERLRGIRARTLELKQQSLERGLDELQFQRTAVSELKARFEQQKTGYTERLKTLRNETLAQGYADNRVIWENIKPKQTKDQILKMVEAGEIDDVVVILSDMQIRQQAKIIKSFETPAELAVLDRIMRLIRQGAPESTVIDKALREQNAQ